MTETQGLQAREKQELQEESTRPGAVFRPDIDILEDRDGYVVYADLPGVDDKSIDVRLDRGTLTLDARLATLPETGWNPIHAEYRIGSYHREFRISEDIDTAGVSAKMHNGVLELVLPKSANRRPRAIQVQAG
ncbi:MAG TPA: Hsp20/alpha crystallin family protein [Candidatus Eisenbacteria bacterium]|jgi:HSP20 family molecular chaperone IbpA|nr:Hsp20/alpha crystallin family protein [Candidatus Eisenbacteria bacterium]